MITENSYLHSIPKNLNKKLIFCLDGIRVSLQTISLSYSRLSGLLKTLSLENSQIKNIDFTHVSLDAWAFIDSVYRFNGLWGVLSTLVNIEDKYDISVVNAKCSEIKSIRNVLAHVSQRLDHIVSSNSSIVGEISWLAIKSENPLLIKTYFLRSGLFYENLEFTFNLPKGRVEFNEFKIGSINLGVSGHNAEISQIFNYLLELVGYLEILLSNEYNKHTQYDTCPLNVLASAELNT